MKDYNEIIKLLCEAQNYNAGISTSTLENEATDAIIELMAENAELREALAKANNRAEYISNVQGFNW